MLRFIDSQTKGTTVANADTIGAALKTAAEIIAAVTTVVGAAGGLQKAVQPVMESNEGKAAVAKGKQAVGGILQKAATAKGAVGEIAGKAASAKSSYDDARAAKKEEKELAKQLKKAKQIILESASQSITYKDFSKQREEDGAAAIALARGLYGGSGCFVIATYTALDFDKDLTDYLNIYVGQGENLGEAIERACSREGDPDVYADVKYKQNVRIYSYPCVPNELDEKYAALQGIFYTQTSKAE